MNRKSDKYWVLCIYLTLALTTFAVYWQVRNCDFVGYDDMDYVTENDNVQAGLTRRSITWAFTTSRAGNWHPLTWLSHMLDCQLFGLNSCWHHISNLLLHMANTLLLFAVFERMTQKRWQSVFIAAAFALHPLHVESVAWISERKDVLSGFFWMLTLTAYVHYVARPSSGRYLLTLLAFAVGLMAKPMLVTLPFTLLLLDYWPLNRFRFGHIVQDRDQRRRSSFGALAKSKPARSLLVEKIPFFALSAASSVVTFIVQRGAGAVMPVDKLPLIFRMANAFVSYLTYVKKMMWPAGLAVFYPHLRMDLPIWQVAAAAMLVVGITVVAAVQARRRPWLVVGWVWYLGTLVPVIGLVQVGAQAMADRYTYIPIIGLFIIVAWSLPELLKRFRYKNVALGIAAAFVLSAMAIRTWQQVRHWQNSCTLFSHAIAVTKDNYVAHHGLGSAFYKQGEYSDAISHYEHTLRIKPNHKNAPGDIGLALLQLGEHDQAASYFRQALNRKGQLHKWHVGLGIIFQKQGQFDKAVQHFYQALQIKPVFPYARKCLAGVLFNQNQLEEALRQYQQVLQSRSLDTHARADTHNDLGVVLLQLGKTDKAVAHFKKALQIKPDFAQAYNGLGYAMVNQGLVDRAIGHFTEALRFEPDWVDPMNNVAWLLATRSEARFRNPREAIEHALQACELTKYKNPSVLDTLAAAYAAAGRFSDAVVTAEKALELVRPSDKKSAEAIQNRLRLYKTGRPYVQP
ncbi:MAG: tetratricopeptide repeat protein [Planctomycetota bacterium]